MSRDRALSDEELEDVFLTYQCSEENKKICKKVLVEGLSVAEVAKKYGKSRQRVNDLAQKAWEEFIKKSPIPEGWEKVTVFLPKDMAEEVIKKAHELRSQELLRLALKD